MIQNHIHVDINDHFTHLYEETYGLVYYIINNHVRDSQTIHDLVQDTFTSAYLNFHLLKDKKIETFRPWIGKIAANKAKDYIKRDKLLLFSDFNQDPDLYPEFMDQNDDHRPDLYAHKLEQSQYVNAILALLPLSQKECVTLYYYDGLSTQEIARHLNICESSVRSRIQYGRDKIRNYLLGDLDNPLNI